VNYHLTLKSANVKTGPIPVSTTSGDSCPESCGSRDRCYAKAGPLAIHWRKVNDGGLSLEDFTAKVAALPHGQLWRHNQAGDLPGKDEKIDTVALNAIVKANEGKRGFTYTHKPVTGLNHTENTNALAVLMANKRGFTVNLSADTLEQADTLKDLGIAPVVVVLPEQSKGEVTPSGRRVVVCPAISHEGVTCESCKLCAWRDREVIIGFPVHGPLRRQPARLVTIKGVEA
jgi:hypothetical protein